MLRFAASHMRLIGYVSCLMHEVRRKESLVLRILAHPLVLGRPPLEISKNMTDDSKGFFRVPNDLHGMRKRRSCHLHNSVTNFKTVCVRIRYPIEYSTLQSIYSIG